MKNWILTIGIKEFKLTDEQKDFYMRAVNSGRKYVEIEGNFLTTDFQTLVRKETLDGKWECHYGNWHTIGAECFCNYEYKELPDGSMQMIEKPKKELIKL